MTEIRRRRAIFMKAKIMTALMALSALVLSAGAYFTWR
jgi:hypothetical protein